MGGMWGGILGSVAGQPTDTVRIRMQTLSSTSPLYSSNMDCVRQILKHEGPRGFMKGLLPPLLGSIPINAVVFPAQTTVLRLCNAANSNEIDDVDDFSSTLMNGFAGAVAGAVQSPLASVTELVKIQLQTDRSSSGSKNTMIGMTRKIAREYGFGTSGLLRGVGITLGRDLPGFASYFFVYDLCQKELLHFREVWLELIASTDRREGRGAGTGRTVKRPVKDGQPNQVTGYPSEAPPGWYDSQGADFQQFHKIETHETQMYDNVSCLVSGGLAGVVSWLITMPIDVLKTTVQAQLSLDSDGSAGKKTAQPPSIVSIAKRGFEMDGYNYFFRGVKPTLMRAFIVNAAVFFGYNQAKRHLKIFDHNFEDDDVKDFWSP
jgi:hypothetical protein